MGSLPAAPQRCCHGLHLQPMLCAARGRSLGESRPREAWRCADCLISGQLVREATTNPDTSPSLS